MNLYELSQAWIDIQNLDIDEQDMAMALDAVNADIDDKLVAISKVVRNLKAEEEAVKAEEQRLKKRRESAVKKSESLMAYARNAMLLTGKRNVSDSISGFRLQSNPPSVKITGEVDTKWCKHVPESWVPDKTIIKQALQAGETIEGCVLVQEDGIRLK